jgi:hypothetical protein
MATWFSQYPNGCKQLAEEVGIDRERCILKPIEIDVLAKQEAQLEVEYPLHFPRDPLKEFDWLSARAGQHRFRGCIRYSTMPEVSLPLCAEKVVELDAPLSVLFVGALLGALQVGVLRQLSILQRYYDGSNLHVWTLLVELGAFVGLRLPVGLCMAVIAIVLARISLYFQGVLQVELKDFWGGVVVGLLAQSTTGPVAEALGRIIGTARQAQSDSEDESRSPPPVAETTKPQ